MKKIIFFILSLTLILCSCTQENIDESTSVTAPETFEAAEEQVFTGIPEKNIEYGFSPQINKTDFSLQLFCYDNNGNIYFSDPADNYNLYVYDGTESKKLTDIKSICLNYYDGKIYFLSPQNDLEIYDMSPEGYPYKYDLESGEVVKVDDSIMSDMTIIDGEMYAMNYDNACFFYKYDKNDPGCRNKKIYNSFGIKKCKDLFLTFETASESGDKINFYMQNETDKHFLLSNDIPYRYFFSFGKFYYTSQNTHELKTIDLKSGETNNLGYVSDFTLLDCEVYCIMEDLYLYKIGNENKLNELYQFYDIYSDNVNLYGIIGEYDISAQKHNYSFVKVNSDFSVEIISKKGESK